VLAKEGISSIPAHHGEEAMVPDAWPGTVSQPGWAGKEIPAATADGGTVPPVVISPGGTGSSRAAKEAPGGGGEGDQ